MICFKIIKNILILGILFIIFIISGCAKEDTVRGNYMCQVNGENLDIFLKEDSKATVKYKGNTYTALWKEGNNKIDIQTIINDKERNLMLLKTDKFDMDLEIYTLQSGNKEAKDACYKLKSNSKKDLSSYSYIMVQNSKQKVENLAKLKSDLALIKSAIMNEKQKRILNNDSSLYLDSLSTNKTELFDKILLYPYAASNNLGKWSKEANHQYIYHLAPGSDIRFEYNNIDGTFECISHCSLLK